MLSRAAVFIRGVAAVVAVLSSIQPAMAASPLKAEVLDIRGETLPRATELNVKIEDERAVRLAGIGSIDPCILGIGCPEPENPPPLRNSLRCPQDTMVGYPKHCHLFSANLAKHGERFCSNWAWKCGYSKYIWDSGQICLACGPRR
ncbi:MAG: hypothetical protein HY059_09830 [Proteobacteria bacterium]|nr:hypothetical protein [Pseudomonadota bacterium]